MSASVMDGAIKEYEKARERLTVSMACIVINHFELKGFNRLMDMSMETDFFSTGPILVMEQVGNRFHYDIAHFCKCNIDFDAVIKEVKARWPAVEIGWPNHTLHEKLDRLANMAREPISEVTCKDGFFLFNIGDGRLAKMEINWAVHQLPEFFKTYTELKTEKHLLDEEAAENSQ